MKTLPTPAFYAIWALLAATSLAAVYILGREAGSTDPVPVQLSCSDDVLRQLAIPAADLAAGTVPARPQAGKYVGSKNGTKYYTPGCTGARRIKPENYVWFSSQDDAILQGYTPGSC